MTPTLTALRVVELADILHHPDISLAAYGVIVEDIWSQNMADPYEMLVFGKRADVKAIVGAAYYQLMISDSPLDSRLTMQQLEHIELGKSSCAEMWQAVSDTWGMEDDNQTGETYKSRYWLHGVWKTLTRGRFKAYDVIGRIDAAAKYASASCSPARATIVQALLDNAKANIHIHFLPDDDSSGGSDSLAHAEEYEELNAQVNHPFSPPLSLFVRAKSLVHLWRLPYQLIGRIRDAPMPFRDTSLQCVGVVFSSPTTRNS